MKRLGFVVLLVLFTASCATKQNRLKTGYANPKGVRMVSLKIAFDTQRIYFTNRRAIQGLIAMNFVMLDELPKSSKVHGLNLENQAFMDIAVSPKLELIAFTVNAGVRDWVGIYDIHLGISEIAVIDHGQVGKIRWDPTGTYLATEVVSPSGLRNVLVYDSRSRETKTVLEEMDANHINTQMVAEAWDPVWLKRGQYKQGDLVYKKGDLVFSWRPANLPKVVQKFLLAPATGKVDIKP